MAEQFLDRPQVRSPVQEMGRCRVPECVRSRRSPSGHVREQPGDEVVDGPAAETSAARTEEERRS